jgi:magnesium chelatase subunit D
VAISPDRRGRYVGARPQEPITDIAIDATVRAAAPHQLSRGRPPGERLRLERSDLRQKIRKRKVGNLVVFAIDASSSMHAQARMTATKGAILSLLQDAYVRRDKVAVIVFRGRDAEVVLRPTSGALTAQQQLRALTVGGTTPLTHGLLAAFHLLRSEKLKDSSLRPLLVVVSDGRGNVSMSGGDPRVEALKVADRIRVAGFDTLVIDSARDFSRAARLPSHRLMYHMAGPNTCAELAQHLGASYHALYDLSRDQVTRAVAHHLNDRSDPWQETGGHFRSPPSWDRNT